MLAAHRLLRIERRLPRHFVEQFTHAGFAGPSLINLPKNRLRSDLNKASLRWYELERLLSDYWPAWAFQPPHAGFRTPESLVRNVYAYYGDRSSDLSRGLPRDTETARQFFDPGLHRQLAVVENPAL